MNALRMMMPRINKLNLNIFARFIFLIYNVVFLNMCLSIV